MGRKRKAESGSTRAPGPSEEVPDTHDRRVRMKINSYEDVAGSDDEFHLNRDKILLGEDDATKRRKKWQEKDEFLQQSEEEVLAESDDEDVDVTDEDDQSADEDASDDGSVDPDAREEQDEGHWGDSKRDYYDADVIETEQDALDEENEARRLQQKRLKDMTAADYGFDEDDWKESKDDEQSTKTVVTEVLPQIQITDDMDSADRLKLLKTRYPEFEPFGNEFVELQAVVEGRSRELVDVAATSDGIVSVSAMKHRAAAAYLAALTMYFALLTSPADALPKKALALAPAEVRSHPVMDTLLVCRKLWSKVKDVPEEDDDDEVDAPVDSLDTSILSVKAPTSIDMQVLSNDSSDDDASPERQPVKLGRKRSRRSRSKAPAHGQAVSASQRAARMREADTSLADLDSLLIKPISTVGRTSKSQRTATAAVGSDLEDETTGLSAEALAAKAAKRKSLRFYTSQIAQTALRRGAAGRSAGGDDDVPHRERLRDRQDRLMSDAIKRGASAPSREQELDDQSPDEDAQQTALARTVNGQNEGGEEYYDLVASRTSAKKAQRESLVNARKAADLAGGARVVPVEQIGADGKRGIGYAIEKNKGLQSLDARGGGQKRKKKDVSNPRVKKRMRYEDKKKKLSSIKPVYKGGEGRGGYGGELTGIKTNIIRSTKL